MPKCGEFNFTLSGLHKSEYILKAELHLWLRVHFPTEKSTYIARIKPVNANGTVDQPIPREFEIRNSSDGYYVTFEVNDLLKKLVDDGKYLFADELRGPGIYLLLLACNCY